MFILDPSLHVTYSLLDETYEDYVYYIFDYDDTSCMHIARKLMRFGITLRINDILELNPWINCLDMEIGQVIMLSSDSLMSQACESEQLSHIVYRVNDGDGCNELAKQIGVTEDEIKLYNPKIDQKCTIGEGVKLVLGKVENDANYNSLFSFDCPKKHVIVEGETCRGIAKDKGITYLHLKKCNPQIDTDCTNIIAGKIITY